MTEKQLDFISHLVLVGVLLYILILFIAGYQIEKTRKAKSKESIQYEMAVEEAPSLSFMEIPEKSTNQAKLTLPELPAFEVKEIPLSAEYQEHLWNMSKKHGVDYDTMLKIMWQESRFEIDDIGYNIDGTVDSGVCQINEVNYKDAYSYGLNPDDPYDNIEYACLLIGKYQSKYGTVKAIAAYKAGETGMLKGNGTEYATEVINVDIYSKE